MAKYIDRLRQEYARGFLVSGRFHRQLMTDLAILVLAQDYGFDPGKLYDFVKKLSQLHDEYADIWNRDSKDTEYSRAKLDNALKAVCGDLFVPWDMRY